MIANDITIRLVKGDELRILDPVFKARNWATPIGEIAVAKVAFDGDRVIGFVIVQLVPHVEPIWIDPEYRGQDLTHDLARAAVEYVKESGAPGVWCMSTSRSVDELCEENEMELKLGSLYTRTF